MNDEQVLELFSSMSDVGLEAFNSWLMFKYVEMVFIPIGVVCIFGFIGWGIFKAVNIARQWD